MTEKLKCMGCTPLALPAQGRARVVIGGPPRLCTRKLADAPHARTSRTRPPKSALSSCCRRCLQLGTMAGDRIEVRPASQRAPACAAGRARSKQTLTGPRVCSPSRPLVARCGPSQVGMRAWCCLRMRTIAITACPMHRAARSNPESPLQKNAVAVAYAKRGKGVLRLNGALLRLP